ncbi:hypothetical protein Scep_024152 [Stephania cephalantha]|uniref:Uncharacterized protein n=1 Tax=Stephania cephalantha TaxID=152367 RepID=A0AAP0HWV7_9MAGN
MVRRLELDAVVQRLAQFEAFVQSHLGMRMDFGASTFQAPPAPPPPPPPQEHHHEVGMDPARSPQLQHDDDDEGSESDHPDCSKSFAELVRRREEHTQATPDRPIDEKHLYYDAALECSKGRVYGLGSLAKRKRRYEDLGASTSREPMVRRLELDAVVQRLAQFEAFVQSHLGMRMDFGASTFQAPPPPPPPPPPQEHHHEVGMDPAHSPQLQHDDDDEDNHD